MRKGGSFNLEYIMILAHKKINPTKRRVDFFSLLFLIPYQNGISVPKNSTTTKNAAEKMNPKVPKKKDNLARPFFVFAPATENTTPTKDNAKLAIYKPLTRSPPSTDFTKFAAGKKNTSEA